MFFFGGKKEVIKVAAVTDILPAPADTANTGFCLDYQEK
jgi:hypothetical protein